MASAPVQGSGLCVTELESPGGQRGGTLAPSPPNDMANCFHLHCVKCHRGYARSRFVPCPFEPNRRTWMDAGSSRCGSQYGQAPLVSAGALHLPAGTVLSLRSLSFAICKWAVTHVGGGDTWLDPGVCDFKVPALQPSTLSLRPLLLRVWGCAPTLSVGRAFLQSKHLHFTYF